MWVSKITEEDLSNEIIDKLLFEGIVQEKILIVLLF